MSHPALECHGLCIGYPEKPGDPGLLLQDLNLSAGKGELICLLGPNGAGKSTLLRTLAGRQAPLAGTILWEGRDLRSLTAREAARYLSIVLSQAPAVGLMSVRALVALGRTPHTGWMGQLSEADRRMVAEALRETGLSDFAERESAHLSDGERQRVMIARALAQDTAIMVLDEPTAYLDVGNRIDILQRLHRLARERQKCILLSTHDLELSLQIADRIWLIDPQRGFGSGSPESLVLSGQLQGAFAHPAAHFSDSSGTFRLFSAQGKPFSASGSGPAHFWALNALRRNGWQLVEREAHLPHLESGEKSWHWKEGEQVRAFESIDELVAWLGR
ncbi:MAG: ABC transporter ATP-binding protein [Calditrichaeota bacterium]|nr:ABC transporter ATP-binding protein [Calditrichota bacterium]